MEITTLLEYSDRSQLRAWLQENHSKEKECWVVMSRSKNPPAGKRAFENAYGYGYQVFHPTPEQEKQMMKEAMERSEYYDNAEIKNL